jgi:hypothetical protein
MEQFLRPRRTAAHTDDDDGQNQNAHQENASGRVTRAKLKRDAADKSMENEEMPAARRTRAKRMREGADQNYEEIDDGTQHPQIPPPPKKLKANLVAASPAVSDNDDTNRKNRN